MKKLTEEQKKLFEIDMTQPVPTDAELDAAFERLQPFIKKQKQLYQEFLKLQAEGKLGENKRNSF